MWFGGPNCRSLDGRREEPGRASALARFVLQVGHWGTVPCTSRKKRSVEMPCFGVFPPRQEWKCLKRNRVHALSLAVRATSVSHAQDVFSNDARKCLRYLFVGQTLGQPVRVGYGEFSAACGPACGRRQLRPQVPQIATRSATNPTYSVGMSWTSRKRIRQHVVRLQLDTLRQGLGLLVLKLLGWHNTQSLCV